MADLSELLKIQEIGNFEEYLHTLDPLTISNYFSGGVALSNSWMSLSELHGNAARRILCLRRCLTDECWSGSAAQKAKIMLRKMDEWHELTRASAFAMWLCLEKFTSAYLVACANVVEPRLIQLNRGLRTCVEFGFVDIDRIEKREREYKTRNINVMIEYHRAVARVARELPRFEPPPEEPENPGSVTV